MIYTIQTTKEHLFQIVEIETVVTRGLYKFTLLGMNPRYASDTKDRVYAALRSSELLNLKSDNRKIIVNLSPDDTMKKEGFYDLGIALSCIFSIQKQNLLDNILAIGGLSISGKIIPSKRILQAIRTAYMHDISIIVCSTGDLINLDKQILEELALYGIRIIHAENLKDLVLDIRNRGEATKQSKSKKSNILSTSGSDYRFQTKLETLNVLEAGIYIALCGGHNIIIETCSNSLLKKYYGDFISFKPQRHFGRETHKRYMDKSLDTDDYDDIEYIENLKTKDPTHVLTLMRDSIVATYAPCSCGYQFNFFEPNTQERKCICSKRSIIQHKRHIESTYFSYFSIKISTLNQSNPFYNPQNTAHIHKQIQIIRDIQFSRYTQKHNSTNKEVFLFPDNRYLSEYEGTVTTENLDASAQKLWIETSQDEKYLKVALTIQSILNTEEGIYTKEKPTISKRALLLALSYIPRMDF